MNNKIKIKNEFFERISVTIYLYYTNTLLLILLFFKY